MDNEKLINDLADIAAETFRLKGVFRRAVKNADPAERKKYMSQFSWFEKKVQAALEDLDIRAVDLTGERYDPGMAVTPLNLDEYDTDTDLVIDRMMEPVIMTGDRLIRTGTVFLKEETDG